MFLHSFGNKDTTEWMVYLHDVSNIPLAVALCLTMKNMQVDDNCNFYVILLNLFLLTLGCPPDPNNLCFFMGNSSRILAKVGIVEPKPRGRI